MKTVTACPAPRVSLAFECPRGGARHLWQWLPLDVQEWRGYLMRCEFCDTETDLRIVHIGKNAYAASWTK